MRWSVVAMVVLVGLCFAPGAGGAQVAERNAALDYLRVILMSQEKDELFEDARSALDQMHPKPDREQEPDDSPAQLAPGGALADALEAEDWLIRKVERASLEKQCDFQVRFEDGHGAMMPHVGPMRKLGLMLIVDARRHALADQPQAAAERLAAAFRLAQHLSGDRIIVTSLAASGIGEFALQESFWLLDLTINDTNVMGILRSALERFPPEDPYNFEAALRTERDIMAQVGNGPDAALRFMQAFMPDAEVDSAEQADLIWKAMGGGEFAEDVDRCSRAYERVFGAWDARDPQAALGEIDAEVENGDHGVVAAILMPGFCRVQSTDAGARASLEALRARVQGNK